MTQLGRARVIVNPIAGAGRVGRQWPAIRQHLQDIGLAFDASLTEGRGHATTLAREAVQTGCRLVVAVGGDGTVNEVANGLVTADGRVVRDTALGIVSIGTGRDFSRTVLLPRSWKEACHRLLGEETRSLDLGEITVGGPSGQERRYFVNVAGLGFDGEVSERANRTPKLLGGTITYLALVVLTLRSYVNKDVDLSMDGQQIRGRMNSVIVCNCRYFGGGMFVAPDASPEDGIFDVVTIGDISHLEFLKTVPRVYNGTHLTHPMVRLHRAREVTVVARQDMWIQADGEVIGRAPVTFRVLPQALRLKV